ncbi:vWA domain-containing protein [Lederbergia citrea]|uniref:VWA domain-containing protein n=1 Tax=Lederbergia citrea TaxID=2833581 RepID=A0A942UUL0_9BACI|nr:VWA domain-containing protein [Lederbergia citrea]MBS4206295.1 VWA domain-containing protein [Lederbergia citrea]MBS4224993.1 VWA domain-containing protein [Lederbergia citrea]
MKFRSLILWIVISIVLTACGDKAANEKKLVPDQPITIDKTIEEENKQAEEAVSDSKEEAKVEEIEVKPLPQTLSELAALPPGHVDYVGILKPEEQKQMDELTKDLPDISGEPSEQRLDAYYNEILAIFQQDFQGPEELIAKLKFQSIGSPDIDDPRKQFKENLNVLVLLDASGSMRADLGGQTQMDAAKKAITNFMKGLPKDANVGLRIYGHKGTGSNSDKDLSCSGSELVYPLAPYNQSAFQTSLDKTQPAGWTPIQLALNEAQKDLAPFKGDENTNIVYLVSDGISTCDDDPVGAAKSLYNSDITPIVNVIGFNIDHEGQKQLKEVAKATEGTYQDVQNAESLQKELDQASEIAKKWADWKRDKTARLKGDRNRNWLDIFGYGTREYKKRVDEGQQVGFALQYLYQTRKLMSRESHDYLRQKNRDYHEWIEAEYTKLSRELHEMNDKKINEAIQMLEEKYIENAP